MNARSPYFIGGLIVLVLLGLGVFLLAHTGSGEPPAAAPPQSPTATPSATEGTPTTAPDPGAVLADESTSVLRVRVSGCKGCQVTAVANDATSGERKWSATVASGVAQLEVPTPNTLGLAFFVQGEKDGSDTPFRTLATLLPAGATPGQPVTAPDEGKAKSAAYCWAGTTLDVAVISFDATSSNGRVQGAWANPALPALSSTVDLSTKPESAVKIACGSATP